MFSLFSGTVPRLQLPRQNHDYSRRPDDGADESMQHVSLLAVNHIEQRSALAAKDLYQSFVKQLEQPVVRSAMRAAELLRLLAFGH